MALTHDARAARSRRTPVTWVRRGGLSTLVFALPVLVVFGLFSWLPIGAVEGCSPGSRIRP